MSPSRLSHQATAHAAAPSVVATPVACFSIQAAAEPSVMPRVLELFAKRGLVPTRWHSVVAGDGESELTIDVQVAGVERPLGDLIARGLRQVVSVRSVLTTEKRLA